jgi:hypothetical protein
MQVTLALDVSASRQHTDGMRFIYKAGPLMLHSTTTKKEPTHGTHTLLITAWFPPTHSYPVGKLLCGQAAAQAASP